jgi:hypothetical protein
VPAPRSTDRVVARPATHTYVRCMAWVLRNERSGGYWHPDSRQGVTLIRSERAYRFSDRNEAELVAARLNATVIHGGAAVYDDGWTVVEG